MDQRFWGVVCAEKGVGPMPVHIEKFKEIATDWADRALDPESDYGKAAAALSFGEEDNDGVSANVAEFVRLVELGDLTPPEGHKAQKAKPAAGELLKKGDSDIASDSDKKSGKEAYPQSA